MSNNQYGFKRGKSCSDALNYLTESTYKSHNENKIAITLFIDLKKAYDTVNHTILLGKSETNGTRGNALKWFGNYLNERKKRVQIGALFSEWQYVNIGVPQGIVSGSLLFIVYISN